MTNTDKKTTTVADKEKDSFYHYNSFVDENNPGIQYVDLYLQKQYYKKYRQQVERREFIPIWWEESVKVEEMIQERKRQRKLDRKNAKIKAMTDFDPTREVLGGSRH